MHFESMSFNNFAWVITGGGAHLRECVDVMFYLKKHYNAKITLFLTKWGYEVSRLFGVLPRLKVISPGKYYEEFLIGDEGMYYIGRINLRRYKALIIAPATSNTVAKIVNGIADTIATALFSQAQKSDVPVIVLPTDIPGEDGLMETEIPCSIDRAICMQENCEVCEPMRRCPAKAIERVDGYPRINYAKCIGCTLCEHVCPYDAVKCWEKVKLRPRPIDVENINKLSKMDNVFVVNNAQAILNIIKDIILDSR
jgi:dihydromethanopterin reductase (acceptor)